MSDPFRDLIKGVEDAHIVDEGKGASEFSTYIDSGSYTLNAAFSGSLFKGIPDNKVSAFAGPTTTGKTFLVLGIMRKLLENPAGRGIYFDTEGATTKQMMLNHGIDVKRVVGAEPTTIQEFTKQASNILAKYAEIEKKDRFPLFMVLDSLGQLPSSAEMENALSGNEAKDFTRLQVIKSCFRTLTLKLAQLQVPLFITNHTYTAIMTYGAPQVMSGGSGIFFAASQIMMLSKSKIKEGEGKDTEILGNIIKVKIHKSRFSKENDSIQTAIHYNGGLDRYYGLLDFALESGVFVKEGHSINYGAERLGKAADIENDGKRFFTQEVLEKIEPYVNKRYQYGSGVEGDQEPEVLSEIETADESLSQAFKDLKKGK